LAAKRNTPQRQIILEAVRNLNIHATAEQVVDYLAKHHPSIGRATVYRNLSHMAETGELLRVGSFYGSTHYDHNCHDHFHFICNQCRQVFDVDATLPGLLDNFISTDGFDISEFNLSFSGECWQCKSGN